MMNFCRYSLTSRKSVFNNLYVRQVAVMAESCPYEGGGCYLLFGQYYSIDCC